MVRLRRFHAGLLTGLLAALCAALGYWQTQRAVYKTDIAHSYHAMTQLPAVPLSNRVDDWRYRRVTLRGQYAPQYTWHVDNRMRDGRFGYEIVSLFYDESGYAVLVNRGWVVGDPSRRSRPRIPPPDTPVSLQGRVYVPHGQRLLLKQDADQQWPRLIQRADSELMRRQWQAERGSTHDVFPHIVRLLDNQAGGLTVGWAHSTVSSTRHWGYAVQWFALSSVLVLLWVGRVIYGRKNARST